MCFRLERARIAGRGDLPPAFCLEVFSREGSLDLSSPEVRAMPVATLALALATCMVRDEQRSACATPSEKDGRVVAEHGDEAQS